MKSISIVSAQPVQPVWPVGTFARVRLKSASDAKKAEFPDGYVRYHALLGIPAPGTNVDADDPTTLVSTTSAVVNIQTGSVKAFVPGDYDVFEVFDGDVVIK